MFKTGETTCFVAALSRAQAALKGAVDDPVTGVLDPDSLFFSFLYRFGITAPVTVDLRNILNRAD